MTQLDLNWAAPLPAHNGTETSVAAAESVRESAATLRARLLVFYRERGARGATDEEAQLVLGMAGNTQRPRRGELASAKYGRLIEESSEKRPTKSGRDATVWRIR